MCELACWIKSANLPGLPGKINPAFVLSYMYLSVCLQTTQIEVKINVVGKKIWLDVEFIFSLNDLR